MQSWKPRVQPTDLSSQDDLNQRRGEVLDWYAQWMSANASTQYATYIGQETLRAGGRSFTHKNESSFFWKHKPNRPLYSSVSGIAAVRLARQSLSVSLKVWCMDEINSMLIVRAWRKGRHAHTGASTGTRARAISARRDRRGERRDRQSALYHR